MLYYEDPTRHNGELRIVSFVQKYPTKRILNVETINFWILHLYVRTVNYEIIWAWPWIQTEILETFLGHFGQCARYREHLSSPATRISSHRSFASSFVCGDNAHPASSRTFLSLKFKPSGFGQYSGSCTQKQDQKEETRSYRTLEISHALFYRNVA